MSPNTLIGAGSRYGITLVFDVRSGDKLNLLQSLVESVFLEDVLLLRLNEDLKRPKPVVSLSVRTNAAVRSKTVNVTSAGSVPAHSLVQIGNGVYRTTNAITAGNRVLRLKWPIRQAASVGDAILTNPVFRLKGEGDPPPMGETVHNDNAIGGVTFTVWEDDG